MTVLRKRIAGSALAREIGQYVMLAIPKAAGGVFLVGLNVALVRLLEPEAYGRFAFCMTLVLLADAIIAGPFDLAVIRLSGQAGDAQLENTLLAGRAALNIKLALGVPLLLITAIPAVGGLTAVGDVAASGLLAASALTVLAILILRSVLVSLQVAGRIAAYAIIESVQLVLRIAAVGILLTLFAASEVWIMVLLGAASLIAALWGGLRFEPGLFRWPRTEPLPYAGILSASNWYLLTIAVGTLMGRIDVLALTWFGPSDRVGIFAAGQIIAMIPELLGTYVAVLLTRRLVAAMQQKTLARLHRRVQPLLFAMAFAVLVVAWLAWDSVAGLVLPHAYARSAEVALILLPGTLAALATIPIALPVVMLHRKRTLLFFDTALFPLVVVAYFLAIPAHGEIGAAWVTCASTLIRSAYVQAVALWVVRRVNAA